jgi:hypothetical protein
VAYLFKAKTAEQEKQPLLGNSCVTRNNGATVGSDVFCEIRSEAIQREPAALREETAIRRGVNSETVTGQ